MQKKRLKRAFIFAFLAIMAPVFIQILASQAPNFSLHSPLPRTIHAENKYEVFGFVPYWNLNKTDNIDYNVLTTLAYFGLPITADGSIDKSDIGYVKFHSAKAHELFTKAQDRGTRVVLTITQMSNDVIKDFLDEPSSQQKAIRNVIQEIKESKLDGVNVDFEYIGNPGSGYKAKFSQFVDSLTRQIHNEMPHSNVTVSVYASSVKDPKLYDIASLGKSADGIFMMAYDFATPGSDNVIPTAPLYGYKEGKYWYDISTAVEDFLKVMPREKLILGLPWYGYEYPVLSPEIKAKKDHGYYTSYWYRGRRYLRFIARPAAHAQTYSNAAAANFDIEGWDEYGQVGWKAYQGRDGWRMLFLDDTRSLSLKYDFAKEEGLLGVGMWALGFDHGKNEMWDLLNLKFGRKLVSARVAIKPI